MNGAKGSRIWIGGSLMPIYGDQHMLRLRFSLQMRHPDSLYKDLYFVAENLQLARAFLGSFPKKCVFLGGWEGWGVVPFLS